MSFILLESESAVSLEKIVRKTSNQKRVYLSCVTREFRNLRDEMTGIFETLGGEVETIDAWGVEEEDLRPEIRAKIESCQIFVQLLGSSFGPGWSNDPEEGSYLQYEHACAESTGKKIWLILAGPDCDRDQNPDEIDRASDDSDQVEAEKRFRKRREMHKNFLGELAVDGYEFHVAKTNEEARDGIFEIWSQPDKMRRVYLKRKSQVQKRKRNHLLVAVAMVALVIGAIGFAAFTAQESADGVAEAPAEANTITPNTLPTIERLLIARAVDGFKNSVAKGTFIDEMMDYKDGVDLLIYRDRIEAIEQLMKELTRKSVEEALSENSRKILTLMQSDISGNAHLALVAAEKEHLFDKLNAEGEAESNETARSSLLDLIALARAEGDLAEARELVDLAVECDPQWHAVLLAKARIARSEALALRHDSGSYRKSQVPLNEALDLARNLVESGEFDQEARELMILVELELGIADSYSGSGFLDPTSLDEFFENAVEKSVRYTEDFPDDPLGGLLEVACLKPRAVFLALVRMDEQSAAYQRVLERMKSLPDEAKNMRKFLQMEMDLFRSLSVFPSRSKMSPRRSADEKHDHLRSAVNASIKWVATYPGDFEGVWTLISNQISLGDALMVSSGFSSSRLAEKSYRAALAAATIYREQNPGDFAALNLNCRAAIKLGGALQETGLSGKSGSAFQYFDEALKLSQAAYKEAPRDGFAISGYIASLQAMAEYLSISPELIDQREAQELDGTAFQVALEYYREHPDNRWVELRVLSALFRLRMASPIVADEKLQSKAEEKLMEVLKGFMDEGHVVGGAMADLYERLLLERK